MNKKTSTRSNRPRELDRRTREGRALFQRLGKSGFAKARRNFKKTGTLPAHVFHGAGSTAREVLKTLQKDKTLPSTPGNHRVAFVGGRTEVFTLRDTNAYTVMTAAELGEEVKRQEKKLSLLRDLHRMRVSMDKALGIIIDGGSVAEATAALELPAPDRNNRG